MTTVGHPGPDAVTGPRALARAVDVVRSRPGPAQLCVMHRGEVVVDVAHDCSPDGLFWIFSASKPFTSVLVHALAERGVIDLDAPIAQAWPQFVAALPARQAAVKATVTARHVLQHRSGVTGETFAGDILAMSDWWRSVRRVERAVPRWAPGSAPAYSPLQFGFVLGDLLQRITAEPYPDLLSREVLQPLGLTDTWLGLPPDLWGRHVALESTGPLAPLLQRAVNRRRTREAVIPAAGISCTARELATFYAGLLGARRGQVAAPVSAATLTAATARSDEGQVDRTLRIPIRWSSGFELGGGPTTPRARAPMGETSTELAFGHNGSNVCVGWADPTRDLAYAYVTARVTGMRDPVHHCAVADAVLAAFPPTRATGE